MACQLKNILILVRRVSLVIKCAIARSGEILFTTHVNGGIAQLVERPFCTRKVSGSNPLASTILFTPNRVRLFFLLFLVL